MKILFNEEIIELHKVDWILNTWMRMIPLDPNEDPFTGNGTSIFKHYNLSVSNDYVVLNKHIPS